MSFDIDTAKQVGGACLATMGAMVGIIYKGTVSRVKKVEVAVATKADNSELLRQRDSVAELFRDQKTMSKDMSDGFLSLTNGMRDMELRIIDRIDRGRG
jgi:hypothetical protein